MQEDQALNVPVALAAAGLYGAFMLAMIMAILSRGRSDD